MSRYVEDKFRIFESIQLNKLDLIRDILTDISDEARISTYHNVKSGVVLNVNRTISRSLVTKNLSTKFNGYAIFISFTWTSKENLHNTINKMKEVEKRLTWEDLEIDQISQFATDYRCVPFNKIGEILDGPRRIYRDIMDSGGIYAFNFFIKDVN